MVSEETVLQALRGIRDPDRQQDIVTLGLVRDLQIADSDVSFTLAFIDQSPQAKVTMHSMASRLVSRIPGVSRVQVKMGGGAKPAVAAPAPPPGPGRSAELIPEVRHTIAVSSGKRSEERRVGKECRSRRTREPNKKKLAAAGRRS